MRYITLVLLFTPLACLFSQPALAAPQVSVHWRIRYLNPQGRNILSSPSEEYLSTLTSCGVSFQLEQEVNYVPAASLRCPGLLDFSRNKALKKRVSSAFSAAVAHLRATGDQGAAALAAAGERARSVDFGISPFGVFFASADGPGVARRLALNVAQERLVILNKMLWSRVESSPELDAFLLHEALGAAGYDDTDYQISSAVAAAARSSDKESTKTGNRTRTPRKTEVASAENGGASVIGHGGDSNQLFFKASLLLLAKKKIVVEGVDPRLIPSSEWLRGLISATPITVAPLAFLRERGLCQNDQTGEVADAYCGGFVLRGVDGHPFLLIQDQLGFLSQDEQRKLVLKIFRQIVSEVVRERLGQK